MKERFKYKQVLASWGLTLLLISSGIQTGYAQLGDRHIQLFDFTYGIQPGTITGLSKDKDGFLWILSIRGVQRFDGNEVNTFSFPKGVNNLFCDEDGRTWVNSSTEIFLFVPSELKFKSVPIQSGNTGFSIGFVFTMPGPMIWANTSKGFLEFDEQQQVFKDLELSIPVNPPYNASLLTNIGSTLYFGAAGQIFRYDILSGQLDSLPQSGAYKLYPMSHDSIIISTWNIISQWYDFGKGEISLVDIPEEMKVVKNVPFSVRSIIRISPNHFMIGSQEGLFLYQQHQKSFFEMRLFYKGKPIYSNDFTNNIEFDNENYVWFASIDGIGRFVLTGQSFGLMRNKQLYDDMPPGVDQVRQMTSDRPGSLWAGTGNGFLHWDWYKNERKLFLPKYGSQTQLAFPSVRGIATDGKYIILAPADEGMWLFDPKTEKYKRPTYKNEEVRRLSENDFVDFLLRLHDGNIIILGRDNLYLMNGKTYEISFLDLPFAKENNNWAFQGKDGLIWITTNNGMYLLDENLKYLRPVPFLTENVFVRAGFNMKDGRFLFSTNDGLYTATLDGQEIKVEKYSDYFNDLYVNILVEDKQGIIWASTDNGIYRYDPEDDRINLFDFTDNVQGFGFSGNSWFLNQSDGLLFLGGINGINYFRPDGIHVLNSALNLFIQRVTGGENDSIVFDLDEKAVLPWENRALEISFVCPYYSNPGKLKFRYFLEGSEEGWKHIGNNNHLRFTSLSPGEYTLILQASINGTDWVPSRNTFSFCIKPPFWLTWWFIGLAIIGLTSAVWWIIRSRNKQIEEQREELEAEQAINYFSTRMVENQSLDELLWDVAKNCIGRLHFEDCVIYLVDEDRDILVQKAAYGPKSPARSEIINPLTIQIGEGITGTVARTGKAELISDTSKDQRYIVDDVRRYSEISVPIISNGRVLGVIDCEHSRKRFFTQRHLSILTTIASLCAVRIMKAKTEAEKSETERILMETKQQMADIEMQALRAQMNPHFIFNCLNSINRYIVKSDQATASLYLTRFAKLIRLILDNSNSKTVTLANELEALHLYIEMESIRFEKKFTYTITVDDDVHPDHVYVPPLIIQPYVENAIWHGLLHKDQSGQLMIHVSMKGAGLLECVVEDNGVGREKAKELKSKSASNSKSLGMKLTESRLAILNQHSNWGASVEVVDLKSQDGEAAGTRVILRMAVDA